MEKHPELSDYPYDKRHYWLDRADWHRRKADEEEKNGYKVLADFRRSRADYFESRAQE